ncbi:MAG: hypothetical protein M3277_03465 [Actinomycetota bacterium]|nr:hypothetical protein [Actinomycetota bacterium]
MAVGSEEGDPERSGAGHSPGIGLAPASSSVGLGVGHVGEDPDASEDGVIVGPGDEVVRSDGDGLGAGCSEEVSTSMSLLRRLSNGRPALRISRSTVAQSSLTNSLMRASSSLKGNPDPVTVAISLRRCDMARWPSGLKYTMPPVLTTY